MKTYPRRLRFGMVGGGRGAFIGAVHRIAARLDDHYELVAGALSGDPERARQDAHDLHIAADRCYGNFADMVQGECTREDKIDVVAVVTPNHLHYPIARAFIDSGIDVICEKPITRTAEEANQLAAAVQRSGKMLAVTYNYTGYPMVRHAREMIADGELGAIRVIQVEYAQGWLTTRVEEQGNKQAAWRTDPERSGVGCIGDIGTHAFHLAEFITGLRCSEVAGNVTTFAQGRRVDDNAQVMMRFGDGASGALWSSQVAPGNENALSIRIYGEKAGLEWEQETPNHLRFAVHGQATSIITRGGPLAGRQATHATRIPAGHPEGYLEGFAQLYCDFAELIWARIEGSPPSSRACLVPTVLDGVRGMAFIEAVVRSSNHNGAWTRVDQFN